VRLLLEHGADPNDGGLVAHAVRRGRGPEFVRLLAAHGADLDRPGGETWRGNVPLRTAYQHAFLRGRLETIETLAELGAPTATLPSDDVVAAIARGERPQTQLPEVLDPDAQEVLILAALRGRLELVVDAVGLSFAGVVGGSPTGTLLHHAAGVGNLSVARALLARGADVSARAETELATPLGCAAAGSRYHELPGRDYVGVAEALVDAGSPLEPGLLEAADGPLSEWLSR
jgi:ankyrin repeat protein